MKGFDVGMLAGEGGMVTEIGDGIAQIYGLRNAQSLELLEFKGGVKGMALNLEEDSGGAVILGPYEEIREGDEVRTTGSVVQVPVGAALIVRVVDSFVRPAYGSGPITTTGPRPL